MYYGSCNHLTFSKVYTTLDELSFPRSWLELLQPNRYEGMDELEHFSYNCETTTHLHYHKMNVEHSYFTRHRCLYHM